MHITETQIEKCLKRGVEGAGGLCLKWGVDGWPDRIIIWPGGRVAFVELKKPGGRTTLRQRRRLHTLKQLGHQACVLSDFDEVRDYLEASRGGDAL